MPTETDDYESKPPPGVWERLRALDQLGGGVWPLDEAIELLEQSKVGLEISAAEAARLRGDEARQREWVREARRRIREGSHRLSALIILCDDLRGEDREHEIPSAVQRFLDEEVVPFYRELAENELP